MSVIGQQVFSTLNHQPIFPPTYSAFPQDLSTPVFRLRSTVFRLCLFAYFQSNRFAPALKGADWIFVGLFLFQND